MSRNGHVSCSQTRRGSCLPARALAAAACCVPTAAAVRCMVRAARTPTPAGSRRTTRRANNRPSARTSPNGRRLNALDAAELFDRYGEANHPAKRVRPTPFLPEIADNWRLWRWVRASSSTGSQAAMFREPTGGPRSARGEARTTAGTLNILLLIGGPLGSRAATARWTSRADPRWRRPRSPRAGLRPDNRFPNRVFGTLEKGVGVEHAVVIPQTLLTISTAAAAVSHWR